MKIPRDAVSILRVSVPLDKLSFRVSLPLPLYFDTPAQSLAMLKKRILDGQLLPRGMYVHVHECVTCVCMYGCVKSY